MLDEKGTTDPSAVVRIDFYGHALESWRDEQTGKVYVAMRRLCDNMGLNWSGQYTKLRQSHLFKAALSVWLIQTEPGNREVIGLDLDMLPAWLMSIHPDRVDPSIRETLQRYQQECAMALRNYWFTGTASRADMPLVVNPLYQQIIVIAQSLDAHEQRLNAQEHRLDTVEAKAEAAANTAAVALDAQQWITIRQYVYKYGLDRQLPRDQASRYGRYLARYCHTKGIPVYDKPSPVFGHENEYPENIIRMTLPRWFARRSAQGDF